MFKNLSTTFTAMTVTSLFLDLAAGAFRILFEVKPAAHSGDLTSRLRYDLGEIDINPDLVRGQARRTGPNLDREILRRGF